MYQVKSHPYYPPQYEAKCLLGTSLVPGMGWQEGKGEVVLGKEEDTEFLSHMLRNTMKEQWRWSPGAQSPSGGLGRQNGNHSSVKIIASFVPRQAWKGAEEGKLLTPQGGGIVGDFFPFLYCWHNAIWAINKSWEEKNSSSVN